MFLFARNLNLQESLNSDEETKSFLQDSPKGDTINKITGGCSVYWVLATLTLSLICVILSIVLWVTTPKIRLPATDFAPATSAIQLHQVRFTGTPHFDENGNAYRKIDPGSPKYVGKPSPEIDAAWNALIKHRYFEVTEDEAINAWGEIRHKYYNEATGGYRAGLDVFHTLHCVNLVRMALDADYYRSQVNMHYDSEHTYHCIDLIRQSVQCQADITPIPSHWIDSINHTFIDSDQVHTCRNIERLHNWTEERYQKVSRSTT